MAANDAAAMPLPNDETTPPVTKIYLVNDASVIIKQPVSKIQRIATRSINRLAFGDVTRTNAATFSTKNIHSSGRIGHSKMEK